MAINYTKMKALSQRLISQNGRTMTFVQILPYVSDPSKPWRGDAAARNTPTVTLDKTVVVLEPSTNIRVGETAMVDDLLKNYDKVIMVDGEDVLDQYHEVIDGTERYRIEYMYKLQPGPVLLYHLFGLRR